MKVTGKKLAQMLELSPSTVRGYAQRGLIPFETTPGGHRRYEPDKVIVALEKVKASLGEVKPRDLAPLGAGEEPRLASGPAEPFKLAPSWRPSIGAAMIKDDLTPARARGPLRVPVVGLPGSSQFAVDQGART